METDLRPRRTAMAEFKSGEDIRRRLVVRLNDEGDLVGGHFWRLIEL
jgi:hypothetical protein